MESTKLWLKADNSEARFLIRILFFRTLRGKDGDLQARQGNKKNENLYVEELGEQS